MSSSWSAPASALITGAEESWAGIWSLAFGAGGGAAALAASPEVGGELALACAGLDLDAALAEIETVAPEVLTSAAAVDLGAPPVDGADQRSGLGVIVDLVDAALARVDVMTGTPALSMRELLALARVRPLLQAARDCISEVAE